MLVKGQPQGDQPDDAHDHDSQSEDDDEPIMMRPSRTSVESTGSPSGGAVSGVAPEGDQTFKSSSILASLLNNQSKTSPTKGSVGHVLAEALEKASKQSVSRERAESLASLSRYFSEKERAGSASSPLSSPVTSPVVAPSLPKRFPSPVVTPVGSGLLSKVLRSSNLGLAFTQAPPITTSANTANLTATSTSSSRGLIRNSSGDNLLSYFQRPSSSLNPDKRRSVDSSELVHTGRLEDFRGLPLDTNASSMPSLVRRASSGDLSSMDKPSFSAAAEIPGPRLYRSNSSGNIKDLGNLSTSPKANSETSVGFFGRLRRSSIGSLTDLVKSSDLTADPAAYGTLRRAPSIDSSDAFRPGHSPPSPTKFEGGAGLGLFGSGSSSAGNTTPEAKPGLFAGARLSSLAGVRGLWSQGASRGSSDVSVSTMSSGPSPTRTLANPGTAPERIETINRALAFEDFGGLGLMSFFGGKKSS